MAINLYHFFFISFLCALCALIFCFCFSIPAIADDTATFKQVIKQADFVFDEVLVTVADDNDADNGKIENLIGGSIKEKIRFTQNPQKKYFNRAQNKRQILRVKLSNVKKLKQVISQNWTALNPRIISVEPDYKVHISATPNDPSFRYLWGLKNTGQSGGTVNADIDAVDAWNITTGSDDVVVAVVDTGIDYTHTDLSANIWTNTGEIPGNGIDDDKNNFVDDVHGYDFVQDDGDPKDEHSHGSHVAGTIAASGNNGFGVTGINWHCRLMACRFLDASGSGSVSDAIKAINYAVANGAKILNNSWGGGGYSSALAEAITNAMNNGVLFVAAAGNDGDNADLSPHYPSGYAIDNVIAVAATSSADGLASFSNYGQNTVHLGAPGVSILSTVLNGQYAWYNGTSMATPHVSGVAALLLANNPSMDIHELKARLVWTGDPVDSLEGKTLSGRRLNAYNALTAVPSLSVINPNSQARWVCGFDWPIRWNSIGGSNKINIYLLKAGAVYAQLAQNIENSGSFLWHIPDDIVVGADYRIWIDDGVNTDRSDANFTIADMPTDYFTRQFSSEAGRFNLGNKSLLLTPDENVPEKYSACMKDITELPTNPDGSEILNMDDDDSVQVTLSGQSVKIYGTSYPAFYIASNGFITFDSKDISFSESPATHFNSKRISGLFRDLDPTAAGSVEYKILNDRAVVTWYEVPEYDTTTNNTFQIEMFYDGRIRISWLTIEARYGICGISQGLGIQNDYTQSNIAGYGPCAAEVESIEITGPDNIAESSNAQFICVARYDNGSTEEAMSDITWSTDVNFVSIDNDGMLTADDVNSFQQCTVRALFGGKSASHTLVINDLNTNAITIKKCTVKAARRPIEITKGDSIICTGDFNITSQNINEANNINIQIYSAADDYLVYEQNVPVSAFTQKRGIFKYRYTQKTGMTGAINSLWFNTNKNTFYLSAKNIDLTGLGCPFYLIININGVSGFGIANENTVNGRRLIPVMLMSGFADTLSVTKANSKISTVEFNDRLSVKGTFTVAGDSNMASGLTVTWGGQSFMIPGEQFLPAGTSRYKCNYINQDGAVISADFNFANCLFRVNIRYTSLIQSSGTVSFGLTFGQYSENLETNL